MRPELVLKSILSEVINLLNIDWSIFYLLTRHWHQFNVKLWFDVHFWFMVQIQIVKMSPSMTRDITPWPNNSQAIKSSTPKGFLHPAFFPPDGWLFLGILTSQIKLKKSRSGHGVKKTDLKGGRVRCRFKLPNPTRIEICMFIWSGPSWIGWKDKWIVKSRLPTVHGVWYRLSRVDTFHSFRKRQLERQLFTCYQKWMGSVFATGTCRTSCFDGNCLKSGEVE